MKPLPTLTKPLRSVDLETKEPAAGAARAHRLLHRARPPRWWRRPWWRSCWPAGYRDKFGGDHIDDALAALRGLRGADRMEALTRRPGPGTRAARWSSSASWGRASPAPRGRWPRSSGSTRSTPTASSRPSSASRSRRSSTARASRPSASARRRRCSRCWSARDGGVVALGGGATGSERVREALRGHTVVHLEVEPEEAWRRATGKGRPLARDRGRFDQLHADRARASTSRWPTPCSRRRGRDAAAPGAPGAASPCATRGLDATSHGVGAGRVAATTRSSWAAA